MITNIFKNSFYERPVAPKWAWSLKVISAPDEELTESELEIFSNAITKIDIPESQMLTTQSQYRGLTFDIPTRFSNQGELNLTFNENSNMVLYNSLINYLYGASYNKEYIVDEYSSKDENIATGMLHYAPFSLYVTLEDPVTNEPRYHFFFDNCMITDIGEVELAYDSDEVIEFSVKVMYNFKFEGVDAEEYFRKIERSQVETNPTQNFTEDKGITNTTDDIKTTQDTRMTVNEKVPSSTTKTKNIASKTNTTNSSIKTQNVTSIVADNYSIDFLPSASTKQESIATPIPFKSSSQTNTAQKSEKKDAPQKTQKKNISVVASKTNTTPKTETIDSQMTKTKEAQKEANEVSKVLQRQSKIDSTNNIVRLSRSSGVYSTIKEKQEIEESYKAQGKTVVWY